MARIETPERLVAGTAVVTRVVAIALATATLQSAWQLGKATLLGRVVFASRELPWMAAGSYLLFFALLAVPLAVAALVFPRYRWAAIATTVCGAAGTFALLTPVSAIATWAKLLLAAGIGWQLARLVENARGPRTWRWVTAAALGFVTASSAAMHVDSAWHERQRIASLPAPPARAPNVLLIVLDAVRAANLSVYGYALPTTPVLERLGREGMTFRRAFAAAPWTLPSHASLFTGRYPTELDANYRRGPQGGIPSLAAVLHDVGYRTAGFTGNEYYTAWDSRLGRDFERWSDYRVSARQALLSAWPWQTPALRGALVATSPRQVASALIHRSLNAPLALVFDPRHASEITSHFLRWQRGLPADRPFFAFLNMFDAHRPRFAPPAVARRFVRRAGTPAAYDAAIAYMDEEVGALLDTLGRRGILERTIVVVVADHGELLGEHGLYGHSTSAWRDVLWVPFVVRYPASVPAGRVVDQPVSLRDVAATILDLAGVPSSVHRVPGNSVAAAAPTSPVFSFGHQGINVARAFPNANGPVLSLIRDSLHYIRDGNRVETLFDLKHDSAETQDVSSDPAFATQLQRARHVVDSLRLVGRSMR